MAQPAPINFGQHFRLKDTAIATTYESDKDVAVHLPEGAEIIVIDHTPAHYPPEPNRRVSITWNGRTFSMFLVDVLEKGEHL